MLQRKAILVIIGLIFPTLTTVPRTATSFPKKKDFVKIKHHHVLKKEDKKIILSSNDERKKVLIIILNT